LAGRMRLVAALRPHLTAAYEAVSGGPAGEASGMNYRSSALENSDEFDEIGALETTLLKALSGVRASELDRGVCLVGPHRDELELAVGGLPARGYASHGESWSLALALRLAGLVAGAEQVLITAAVPVDIPAVLVGARFTVRAGVVAGDG